MALTIPHSFVNDAIAEASEVNANFQQVKLFVDALQDGTGIDSLAITDTKLNTSSVTETKIAGLAVTEAKIAENAVTKSKVADRAIGSAELDGLAIKQDVNTVYTLVLSDAHKLVTLNNGSPITVTVPVEATVAFLVGDQVNLLQIGAGQVTVAGAVGVTIRSQGPKLKLNGQYAAATLVKIAANEWVLIGNTAA
jgi:hypothetical protein